MASAMNSSTAGQYQDEWSYAPPQVPFLMGPATRQIQNPHSIFMNYPQQLSLRTGSAFQPMQARDGCPGFDLMALQPMPQPSTPELYHAPNYYPPAEIQQPNHVQSMYGQPVFAGFNGYHQSPPNVWHPQHPVNDMGAAFPGMPAGKVPPQVPPQALQPSSNFTGAASPMMLINQAPQSPVNITGPFPQGRSVSQVPPQALPSPINPVGGAPWGTRGSQTPHGSHQPSTNIAVTGPQKSPDYQPFQPPVSISGITPQGGSVSQAPPKGSPQAPPQALQSSVNAISAAPWGILLDQTPCENHQSSTDIAMPSLQKSPDYQPFQPPVSITGTTPQKKSVSQAPHKVSPQFLPQAFQSTTNIAATTPQKSPVSQPSQPSIGITGAAPRGTHGSQSPHGSHQSFTSMMVTTLQEMLVNQSPRPSVSTIGTTPQGKSVGQAPHESPQPSTNLAVAAPQKSPVNQLSVGTTRAAPQGRSVGRKDLQVHRNVHGSQVNGIRKSTSTKPPVHRKVSNLAYPEQLKKSPRNAQPQEPQKPISLNEPSPADDFNKHILADNLNKPILAYDLNEPIPAYDLNKPMISPPPPPAKDLLTQNGCVPWEIGMARYLYRKNVMGLYRIGDSLCDVHLASGAFVKVATHDVTPDKKHFWRHNIINQRIHSNDGKHLNGKAVYLSNGALAWMEDEKGEMIMPKWQFADPVDLKRKSKEESESKELKA